MVNFWIVKHYLYPILLVASLSEHGRSRWPLACLPFWLHLRQLLLLFLRSHLFDRLFQKYKFLWLRSPSTGYNYGTWSVWPGGSLDSYYYIEDSYGRRSPLTWDVAGAYDVRSSGDVGYYYDSDVVIPSYGRTDRRTRIGIILLFF